MILIQWDLFIGFECIQLDQPAVMVVKPGETFSIPCKITGYSASGVGYTNWIRHSSGRGWNGSDGSITLTEMVPKIHW